MKKLFVLASILLPAILAAIALFLGEVKFWYDPARDLISAWDNLSKPTLIGPTSGIPGIFYGPYWIWLLSFGELFSKNPVLITFVTATIPYFIIFPFVWFKFTKYFGQKAVIIGWLLFILGNGFTYGTQLWNPYPAPLFTILLLYLLIRFDFTRLYLTAFLINFFIGFLLGLIINFHISFGIGLSFGVFLFLLWECLKQFFDKKRKNLHLFWVKLSLLIITGCGILVAFLPTLLFEIRHGFNQIKTVLHAFTQYGNVVTTKGLSKYYIFTNFIDTFSSTLHLPTIVTEGILLILIGIFIWLVKNKRVKLNATDVRILTVIITTFFGVAFIYFTAKNPVWAYHFIGVDILSLLFLTFLLSRLPFVKNIFLILVAYVIILSCYSSLVSIQNKGISGIDKQKQVVQTIAKDAENNNYTVFAYSPSIYSYEYTYIFRWVAKKNVPFDPGQNQPGAKIIYLIVPHHINELVKDFIHFRGSNTQYMTTKQWTFYNDVTVLKKVTVH